MSTDRDFRTKNGQRLPMPLLARQLNAVYITSAPAQILEAGDPCCRGVKSSPARQKCYHVMGLQHLGGNARHEDKGE